VNIISIRFDVRAWLYISRPCRARLQVGAARAYKHCLQGMGLSWGNEDIDEAANGGSQVVIE